MPTPDSSLSRSATTFATLRFSAFDPDEAERDELFAFVERGGRVFPRERGAPFDPAMIRSASTSATVVATALTRSSDADWHCALDASGLALMIVAPHASATLELLERKVGPLPPTVESRSGRDNRHLWFRASPIRGGQFARGVDFRAGKTATAVLPPSLSKSGEAYRWTLPPSAADFADLPAPWLELLARRCGGGSTLH